MSTGASRGRVYLIDAHSLIFQVFHAIPEMTSPSGLPTNAVFGFTKDMLTLRAQNPDYLICCFDLPGPTFREKIYADYKANRAPMPRAMLASRTRSTIIGERCSRQPSSRRCSASAQKSAAVAARTT